MEKGVITAVDHFFHSLTVTHKRHLIKCLPTKGYSYLKTPTYVN